MLKNIQAVVFDLDNTLVSCSLNFGLIRQELGCDPKQDLLAFVENLPTQEQQHAHQTILQHELDDAQTSVVLEGTHALLKTLKSLKLKTAIITRNCKQAAHIKVTNSNIDIPIVLTREDHPAKPSPEALLHLADTWNLASEQILYVGDYIYDLQLANNAQTKSCLVQGPRPIDFAHMADLVVDDLTVLNEEFAKLHSDNRDLHVSAVN